MDEEKTKRLVEVVADISDFPKEKIHNDSRLVDELGMDSLDCVTLVIAIEDKFDIDISDDEAERLRTVGDVITYMDGDA